MKKENRKERNQMKITDMKWVDIPVTLEHRTTGSGLTFGGRYVPKVRN